MAGLEDLSTMANVSAEELKIRNELEKDIERNLEEEIKDGIYHLALRLHRLYQHLREKNVTGSSLSSSSDAAGAKNATLSEVNINIKMEGGTKIEIKETKKEARPSVRPRTTSSTSEKNVRGTLIPNYYNDKKFDWIKTLRSGPRVHQAKHINKRTLNQNHKIDYSRRNCVSASRQRKASVQVNKELLELGWKD